MSAERRFTKQSAKIETRADGKQFITGYAAVFYRENDPGTEYVLWNDEYGRAVERIDEAAFTRSIKENDDVRGLFNHDSNVLLGRRSSGTLSISVDSRGLKYEIAYDENDSDHQRMKAKMDRGDLDGSSFAFRAKDTWFRGEDGNEIRTITEITELFDVGPVTYPAYQSTTTGMRANPSDDIASIREERKLLAAGKLRAEMEERSRELKELGL